MKREEIIGKFVGRIGWTGIRLMTTLVVLFLTLPLVMQFIASFSPTGLSFSNFSFRHYVTLFSREAFVRSLVTSFALALLASVISLIVAIPSALAIVRYQFRGKEFLSVLFTSPLIIPGIAVGQSMLTIFLYLNIYGFIALLLTHVIITFPLVLRPLLASLQGLDRSLEEAAMNLGANEITTFTKITFPLIRTGVLTGLIFALQVSFNNFTASIFLVSSRVNTVPIILWSWTQRAFDPGLLAGAGAIFIGSLFLIIITEKMVGIGRLAGAM